MKVKSLEVDSHPVLGSFCFDFDTDKNVSILVGKNGSGKTQLMNFLHILLDKSFRVWEIPEWEKGSIVSIKLAVELNETEKENVAEMNVNGTNVPYSLASGDVYFQARRSSGTWNDVSVYMHSGTDDVYVELPSEVKRSLEAQKPLGKVLHNKTRYSGTQINFQYTPVTTFVDVTDNDENIKTKASESLADDINKLLVSSYNRDNARLRKLVDSGEATTGFSGDFDRFRDAYHHMFSSKIITGVEQDGTDNKVMLQDTTTNAVFGIDGLSSGEQQVVYRVGYLLQNLNVKQGGVVFVDEPELSLHPEWQINYLRFLEEVFGNNIQFIIATHSPFIIQSALSSINTGIYRIINDGGNSASVRLDGVGLIDKKTVASVNYNVFKVHPEEYHTELYLRMSSIIGISTPKPIDTHLFGLNTSKFIPTISTSFGDESVMSFIRNIINHGDEAIENRDGRTYIPDEMEQSIRWMEWFIAQQ